MPFGLIPGGIQGVEFDFFSYVDFIASYIFFTNIIRLMLEFYTFDRLIGFFYSLFKK